MPEGVWCRMSRYRVRYEKLLGELPQSNEDHKRSASVNLDNGLFHCMACEASHNYPTFRKAYVVDHDLPDEVAPPKGDKFVSDQAVRDMHFALLENQNLLDRIRDERGIGIDTLQRYQIGYHARTRRIAIPIRDTEEVVRNVRLYSFTDKGQQKMLSWRQGFGTARLWPLKTLDDPDFDYVFLCEGEMDRLVLAHQGLNAVTATGGAKTWKSEWSREFEDLKVYIVYDMDQAGDERARKAAHSIGEFAAQVRVVRLDSTTASEKDTTIQEATRGSRTS